MLVEDACDALLLVAIGEELELWLLWLAEMELEPELELLSDVRVENVVELARIDEALEARDELDEERVEEDEPREDTLDVPCDRVLDTELAEDLELEVRESDTEIELLCTPVQVPKPSWQP